MGKTLLLSLLVLVAIGGMSIQDAFADIVFNANDLQLLDISGNTVTDVECRLKQTTLIYFADGSIEQQQSSLLIANPFITLNSFLSPEGKEVIRFAMQPKIFCSGSFAGTIFAGIDSNGQEDISQIRVFANLPSGEKVLVHVDNIELDPVQFRSGDPNELPLGTFHFTASDVYENLPQEDYVVTLEIQQIGDIHFVGSSSELSTILNRGNSMWIPVNPNDITSFYVGQNKIDIPADDDNDGIPNSGDNCPTLPETFNGFEDNDGCPDTAPSTPTVPQCGSNQILFNGFCIQDPNFIPETPSVLETPEGVTQIQCEAEGGIWNSQFVFINLIPTIVFTCTIPQDPVTTSTTKLCNGVLIPIEQICQTTEVDSDGDGVPDSIDQCDFARETFNSFEDEDGCPDIPPTIDDCVLPSTVINGQCIAPTSENDAENIAILQSGQFIHKVTFTFEDGNTEEYFPTEADSLSGNIATSQSTLTQFTPAQLTGSISGSNAKPLSSISFETFYTLPASDATDATVLASSFVGYSPTLTFSSAQIAQGSSKTARINFDEPLISLPNGKTGASFGVVTFQAIDLRNIGVSAGLTTGQSRMGDIDFQIVSNIKLEKGTTVADFTTQDGFITINDFTVTNEVTPVASVNCEAVGLVPDKVDPLTGKTLTCKDPSSSGNTDICITLDRPQGFSCDTTWQNANCSTSTSNATGEVFSCVEPDNDGDGIPNIRDSCVDVAEDFDPAGNISDGCPFEGTPISIQTCPNGSQIPVQNSCSEIPPVCFGDICLPPVPTTTVCLQNIAVPCTPAPTIGQIDTTTLIIIGSVLGTVGLVGIVLAKRRS